MNTPRSIAFILLVGGIVASIGVCIRAWHHETELRYREHAVYELFSTHHRLAFALSSRRSAVIKTPLQSAAAHSMAPVERNPEPKRSASPGTYAKVTIAQRQLPEYRQWRIAASQRRAMREYGEWFSQLKLEPERLALVKLAIADRLSRHDDTFDQMAEAGIAQTSQQYRDAMKLVDDAANAQLQKLLSPEGYVSLQRFERLRAWTNYLPEIDEYFADRGILALGPEQRQMFTTAAAESQQWAKQNNAMPPGVRYRMQAEQIGTSVSPLLGADQRQAFADYIKFFTERHKLTSRLLSPDDPDGVRGLRGAGPAF